MSDGSPSYIEAVEKHIDGYDALQTENARLREALQRADDELTNLQPHIPGCCYPGKAGFIDAHVDVAQQTIRAALGAEKPTEGETT